MYRCRETYETFILYSKWRELSYERDILKKNIKIIQLVGIILFMGLMVQEKDALDEDCKITLNKNTMESLVRNSSVVDYLDTPEAE